MAVSTLFGQPASPATLTADNAPYTLGTQFSVLQDVALTGIWFHSAPGAVSLPTRCGIWDNASQASPVTGTDNASPSWSGAVGSGWVKCTYDGSVTLHAGNIYKTTALGGGSNWYSATSHYWDTGPGVSGITSGPLTAPNSGLSVSGQSSFQNSATFHYPLSSFNASNYWIDVEVTAIASPSAANLLVASFP